MHIVFFCSIQVANCNIKHISFITIAISRAINIVKCNFKRVSLHIAGNLPTLVTLVHASCSSKFYKCKHHAAYKIVFACHNTKLSVTETLLAPVIYSMQYLNNILASIICCLLSSFRSLQIISYIVESFPSTGINHTEA